jgi:formiminotetrahydrofolate cyclodeaminase
MLVDRTVRDLIAAFGSSDPTPGGGSASALASAVGASLLLMVAGMPKTRNGAAEERASLQAAANELATLRTQLSDAIDADTAAYDRVVAAYRLPKGSDEERAARQAGIQAALRGATDVPLDVMRWSRRALEQAAIVARDGHRAAASDVGVAAALLQAGARGARLNVDINVDSLRDGGSAEAIGAEAKELSAAVDRAWAAVSINLS